MKIAFLSEALSETLTATLTATLLILTAGCKSTGSRSNTKSTGTLEVDRDLLNNPANDESLTPNQEVCQLAETQLGLSDLSLSNAAPRQDCIEKNAYMQAAYKELFNKCRNYCYADDQCYNRATAMLGELKDILGKKVDLRGKDKEWCTQTQIGDSDTPKASCDDLAYKVVIRYGKGKWSYHIASLVKTCKGDGYEYCAIDPIDKNLTCKSARGWCNAWAHGDIMWGDTANKPSSGFDFCEVTPGNQYTYQQSILKDPYDKDVVSNVKCELKDHVTALCEAGRSPYPSECWLDTDSDGVPDDLDKCPNTTKDSLSTVEYCDKGRIGCASDEMPVSQ